MNGRAVIIGIDGLDLGILERWFSDSDIPHIMKIVREGASGPMKSVMPLNSASAWTSLITGRSPAGHGVYGFTRTHDDFVNRSTSRCDDIGAAPLWEIANHGGLPVGLVNCPMTWPPPALDSFVISGIPIPYNQLWAFPHELEVSLRDRFGPYIVDLPWSDLSDGTPGRRESFIAGLYGMARKREEAALLAMKKYPWRILAVIFTGTDRLLHSFWHLSDPSHPSHDLPGAAAHGRDIMRYFVLLDEIIGRIVSEAGDDTPVFLVSDHGFGPLHYRFHLRRWLENRGYLVSAQDGATGEDAALDEPLRGIDWKRTVAYPASLSESGVWINKYGRQRGGSVKGADYERLCQTIAAELVGFAPHEMRPVERVWRREEILAGPYIEEAPDIIIKPRDTFIVDDSNSPSEISPSTHETATHRLNGIFAAHGPMFRRGVKLDGLNIVDVLPTVLATLGVPIPASIEGKPALDAFVERIEPIRSKINLPPRKRREPAAQDDEEEQMKKQLKGIGYL